MIKSRVLFLCLPEKVPTKPRPRVKTDYIGTGYSESEQKRQYFTLTTPPVALKNEEKKVQLYWCMIG